MAISLYRAGVAQFVCGLAIGGCLILKLSAQEKQQQPDNQQQAKQQQANEQQANPCPPSGQSDTDHQLGFGKIPPVLLANTDIEVTVTPRLNPSELTALCFDSVPLPVPRPDTEFNKLTIPPNPAAPQQPWPRGDHFLYAVVAKKVIKKAVQPVPTLNTVRALEMRPADNTFRVQFLGDGFDQGTPTNNTIRMELAGGVTVDQDVCWTDADCNAKNSKVRANVISPKEIVASGLDASDERQNRFQVCVSSLCTDPVPDDSTTYLWLVPAVSLFGCLILALVVVILAWQMRPVVIEGEKYLLSSLFLDKETNTYSLSKLQFYVWTFVAIFGYITLVISRNWFQHFHGLPPIPSGLPGIVAIAAGSAVGSQVVTNVNGPKGAGQPTPSLSDFVTTGEVVAAERVQFLVWTLIGAFSFFAIVWVADPRNMTELPEVPWSLLSISGLSALGYLGGKLARDAGPVIIEINAKKGPDPTPAQLATGSAAPSGGGTAGATTPSPAITDARNKLAEARTAIGQITTSADVQRVLDAAHKACDAADKAVNAAVSGQAAQAKTSADDATTSATAAATATQPLKAGTPDGDNAIKAASAAQKAAQAAQAAAGAVAPPGSGTAPANQTVPAAATTFGLLDIRGRTLSRDATFRISQKADPGGDDLDIAFDTLQPDPNDQNKVKKPRILELDPDAKDPTVGKRLLLVVSIADPKYASLFDEKSAHTLTITNPDSQKAMLKFSIPESQKPS